MKKSVLTVLAEISTATIFVLSLSSCGTNVADKQTSAETLHTTLAETASEITEAETEATTTTSAKTTSETTETETETESTTTTAETTEAEKICTCESEFQHACCEYLNELNFFAGGIYFGDINGDDKSEAVIEINPAEFTYVLYENENGMQELPLETISDWGCVRYIADTKQILLRPFWGHTTGTWGYEEYYLYSWNGSDYEVTSSILRKAGYYEDSEHSEFGQAYIDGEEVDNDTFEVKRAEFVKLRDENPYFPITYIFDRQQHRNPEPETYINYIKENFPCFDNWDIIPEKIW